LRVFAPEVMRFHKEACTLSLSWPSGKLGPGEDQIR